MLHTLRKSKTIVSRVGRLRLNHLVTTSISSCGKLSPVASIQYSPPSEVRRFSTAGPAGNQKASDNGSEPSTEEQKQHEIKKYDFDDEDYYEDEPVTAGQKVRYYGSLLFQVSLLLGIVGGAVYTFKELIMPGRVNAHRLFSEAYALLQLNDEIRSIVGDQMVGYGRDFGTTTEGRRNHIDEYRYTGDDGSARIRVRFNIKGKKGRVMVWAEVSDMIPDNEYVYLICQDMRTGRVITIQDNRERLDADYQLNPNKGSKKGYFSWATDLFGKQAN